MRIRSVRIDAFGALEKLSLDDLSPRLVAVFGPNESGKSTIRHFLGALLFGFQPAKREAHPFTPWSGAEMGGEIEIEMDSGSVLRVHRRLLATPWGRLTRDGEMQSIGNNRLPEIADLRREILEGVYALSRKDLEFPEKEWGVVRDRLLGSAGLDSIRPARVVAEEMEREGEKLWRPDRRGSPKAAEIRKQISKLGKEVLAAREREKENRRMEEEEEHLVEMEASLQEKLVIIRASLKRFNRLLPLRATVARIRALEEKAGDLSPFRAVSADPIEKVRALREKQDEGNAQLASKIREKEERLETIAALGEAGSRRKITGHDADATVSAPPPTPLPSVLLLAGALLVFVGALLARATAFFVPLLALAVLLLAGAGVAYGGYVAAKRADLAAREAVEREAEKADEEAQRAREKAERDLVLLEEEVGVLEKKVAQAREEERSLVETLRALGREDLEECARILAERRQAMAEAAALRRSEEARQGKSYDELLRELEAEEKRAEAEGDWTLSDEEVARLEAEEKRVDAERAEGGKRIAQLRAELRNLQAERSAADLEGEREALREEARELRRRRDRLALLAAVLREADARYRAEQGPRIEENAAAYLAAITGNRYKKVSIEGEEKETLHLFVPGADEFRPADSPVSQGTLDQAFFSLRLALIDYLEGGGEKLPLFLDELLAHWDAGRTDEGLRILKEVSRTRQVFFFTCHRDVFERLTGEGATAVELSAAR